MTWRELRDADILLGAVRHAKLAKCVAAKRNDAKFTTYHSLIQGVAFNFQVGCHECFSPYYQVKGSKREGSLCSKGGIFSDWRILVFKLLLNLKDSKMLLALTH